MKTYTLNEVQNQLIGKIGTPERDAFEYELQMELIGKTIKQTRLDCQLTQEELGKITGVQREQISKLEKKPRKCYCPNIFACSGCFKS